MVKVCSDKFPPEQEGDEGGYYLDGKYKKGLDNLKKATMENDRQSIILYCGDTGSGKSTKMAQDCFYFDPENFTYEDMCQTYEDFAQRLQKKRKMALALDEAHEGLSSGQVATRAAKALTHLIQVSRQQNNFIGISLPNFFDLNKNAAIFSSNWLVYVYSKKGKRGFFKVFDKEKKKLLYLIGKKNYNYNAVKPNFRGRFTKFMPIDENKYREKKKEAIQHIMDTQFKESESTLGGDAVSKSKQSRDNAIKKLYLEGKTIPELEALFNLSSSLLYKIIEGTR